MALRARWSIALVGTVISISTGCSGNWPWQTARAGDVKPAPTGVNAQQWLEERGDLPATTATSAAPARSAAAPVSFDTNRRFGQPEITMGAADRPDASASDAAVAAALGRPSREDPGVGPMEEGPDGLRRVSFADEGSDFNPRISRDGRWMVFASTQHRATADLYMKSIDGRTVTQLTADPANDIMPAISPDGQRIAFASDRSGRWQLYVMSAAGGQAVQLTDGVANDLHPTWSSDGKSLAFCRLGSRSGRWEIWVLSPQQPAAAEFIGYGMFPEWCPTPATGAAGSDRILFQRGRERGERAYSIWTVDYKPGWAGNPTEIVSGRDFAAINGTWSPDGKWIAYATVPIGNDRALAALAGTAFGGAWSRPAWRTAEADGDRSELWLTSIDGSARVNLTGGRWVNVMPAWGPSNRVYFVSNRGGLDNVWSLSTERALAGAGPRSTPATGTATATPPAEPPMATAPAGE